MQRPAAVIALATVLGVAGVGAVLLARAVRTAPARCPGGAAMLGPRCCGPGQYLDRSTCTGRPAHCPSGMTPQDEPRAGCVPVAIRVLVPGGQLALGPSDWEAQGKVEPRTIAVEPFEIDSTEVTNASWLVCSQAGACEAHDSAEPGVPVTRVTAHAAARFCQFVGGRLPTSDEWVIAAAGHDGRRYPWGQTGLVCRRAVFGLVDGPCATGGVGPEIGGMRPDGATPDGVLDLAGNVAEWTVESDGGYAARGGSFRSRVAGELKSWSVEEVDGSADHVGFRCAYDVTGAN